MNVKLKVLRKVLEEAIANIDAGNSNHSDDELDDIIFLLLINNLYLIIMILKLLNKIF